MLNRGSFILLEYHMANELLCVWVVFFCDYPNRLEELFLISPSRSFFRVSGLSSLSDEFP